MRAVLGIDPQRRAFQIALARAYNAFARQYSDLTASLFDNTFLKTRAAPVLVQLLQATSMAICSRVALTFANIRRRP